MSNFFKKWKSFDNVLFVNIKLCTSPSPPHCRYQTHSSTMTFILIAGVRQFLNIKWPCLDETTPRGETEGLHTAPEVDLTSHSSDLLYKVQAFLLSLADTPLLPCLPLYVWSKHFSLLRPVSSLFSAYCLFKILQKSNSKIRKEETYQISKRNSKR